MHRDRHRRFGPALLFAFGSVVSVMCAQGPLLLKEVASREFSIQVGGVQDAADVRQVVSHELSIHVESGIPEAQVVSREFGLLVTDAAPPPVVTELTVDLSPTGDTAILDWSGYNQWAVGDIARFDIYFTDAGGFTDVSAMTPYLSVPSETTTVTLEGLAEFTDHFFAVVAVDGLGNFESAVDYSAAYILSPQVVSREFAIFVGHESVPPAREVASREFGIIVADADPPPTLTNVTMTVSPSGDSVVLDWQSYNQWEVGDIARFDIYFSDAAPFDDVSAMTPYTSVPVETTTLALDGLTPNTDHYFAVVPVDALGHFESAIHYSAAYVLSPQVVSREFSLHVGRESSPPERIITSRELSIVVPDDTTPAPVTGVGSGFFVETSTSEFGAVDLDWTSYNELAQHDVVQYRIYVGNAFFDDATGLTPFEISQSGQRVTLAGLPGGEIFHFAVVAEDVLGNFDPVVRSFSAKASVSGVGEVINLAVAESTMDRLGFSWEAPPDTAAFLTGYHLYFGDDPTPLVLPPGTTSNEFTGLDPATGYSLRIATLDVFGQESSGVTLLAATLLPNPANLALTLQDGRVVALWDAVAPAPLVQHYAVYLEAAPISDTSGLTPVATTTATSFDLGPLATVMDRHVAVAAVNISNAGDPNVASVQATKLAQTIAFPALAPAHSIPLVATASSGLPVRFEVTPANLATISGAPGSETLDALGGGNVTVTAYQDGDAAHWPAPPVAQSLRLPPVIASFTADGTEIGPGTLISRLDTLLRVEGIDENGLSQAAFAIRPVGGSFTPLGVDTTPVDGFTGVLAIDALADGDYELQAEITAALTTVTAPVVRPVTIQLAPPVPPTITAPASGTGVTSELILIEGLSSRETDVFLDRNGSQIAGPLTPDPTGRFTETIPLVSGPNAITARATNRAGASGNSAPVTITLLSNISLALAPSTIPEGTSANLTVTRNHPQGPLTVTLSQNVSGQLNLPPPVVFADGESQKIVPVTAVDDDDPELDETVIITGQGTHYNPGTVTADVIDDDRPGLTLALNRTAVSEASLAGDLTATVTRTPVTATPFVIALTSSDSTAVLPADSLAMAPFSPDVTANLTVVDDPVVDGDQPCTITARILDPDTGSVLAESNPVVVTVTDDDGPTLTLELGQATVQEGDSVTAFLGRNSGIDQPLTVDLSVDRPLEASVPVQVTFAADQSATSFQVAGLDDGTPDGNQSVLLEASAAGFTPAQAQLIVTDEQKPDLAITVLTAPSPVLTDEWINYTYRIENQGPADAAGAIGIRVLLSDDPVHGDDTELNTFVADDGLPAGLFLERSETFRTPIESGTYWIILEVDGENIHDEILETNNLGVSEAMEVGASYAATVSTDTTIAPSGTPILLTGSATHVADLSPAAEKLVHVHVMLRDTVRLFPTLTDMSGGFSVTFTPLPGEGGTYTVGATHPGDPDPTAQDSFTLVGFVSTPSEMVFTATRNETSAQELLVHNIADIGLSGIAVAGHGFPAGITISGSLDGGATTMDPLADATVRYDFTATASAPNPAEGFLRITSAEGALLDVPVTATIRELESLLVTNDAPLQGGMTPGDQSFVHFTVRNDGSAPTGPVRILLPAADWLSAATPSPMPSLDPGAAATVSLQLHPAADLPLTSYSGTLLLAGDHNTLPVPFSFRAMASTTGDLTVLCEDEFTYFAEGTPPLAGATVRVIDAIDGSEVASGTSGPDGTVSFTSILSGQYYIEASAPDHGDYREPLFLPAGGVTHTRVFLPRQLIDYVWNVVPTQIEDRYEVVVESVFETNVPAPVLDVNPGYVDLRNLANDVIQIELTIKNQGIIDARDVRIETVSSRRWEMSCPTTSLGNMAGQAEYRVPLTMRRHPADPLHQPSARVTWWYPCGEWKIYRSFRIIFEDDLRIPIPRFPVPTFGPFGLGDFRLPPIERIYYPGRIHVISCDPCIIRTVRRCGSSPGPNSFRSCHWSAHRATSACGPPGGRVVPCVFNSVISGYRCVGAFNSFGSAGQVSRCYLDILGCIGGGSGGGGGGDGCGGCGRGNYDSVFATFEHRGAGVVAMADLEIAVLGDQAWRPFLANEHMDAFMRLYRDSILDGSEDDAVISAAERAALLAMDMTGVTGTAMVDNLVDRWNLTVAYYAAGIVDSSDLPEGFEPDFIPYDVILEATDRVGTAYEEAFAAGFSDPIEAYQAAQDALFAVLSSGEGVCARVRLQISQDAVLAREAFTASLDIINGNDAPVTNVGVSLFITDANGADVTSLFGLTPPVITGVNGGAIAGESTGSWRWTLVPGADAAPTEPTTFYVEGSMSYEEDGVPVDIPLTAQEITVHPNPRLFLKYFHQRDVYADDPLTPAIEPSVPFSLGIMVDNRGAGTARNFRITSAEPEIIENDKQVLIGFDIIGTEIDGAPASPSLVADFGEIAPGEVGIARWLLTCDRQGHFISYDATFTHVDDLGGRRLSLIEDVEIHETIHEINALGAKDDGLPDFFTNDIPDARDIGDTLHLSDGTTAPVALVETATIDPPAAGNLVVTLNAPAMGAGWSYLRIPDPGAGGFALVAITRSDGLVIPVGLNAWTTDRSFVGLGLPPVPDDLFHLVDCDSTGSYTVEYAATPPPDTTAPTSTITMLADQSGTFIDLAWSGIDAGGIAFFDVYVSTDGGPFTLWMENTSATSALFTGQLGSTYAFHSIATDPSGNVEPPKTTGETQTTVSLTNQAPQLDAVPDLDVVEGTVLSHRVTATDPDGPDSLLRFAVASDQPGIVIDPVTGWLTWSTSDHHGGDSVEVTVTVTDGDPDPMTDTQVFQVHVEDTNAPPVLAAPGQFAIDVGEPLQVQLSATDPDVPAQMIGYFLAGTPPAGMTLDPVTGRLDWTPGDIHEDQSFEIGIEVYDDQVPAGVAAGVLYIDVLKKPGLPPVFDPFPIIVWPGDGQFFQAITARDPEGEPVTIHGDTSGLPGWVAVHATPGSGRALLEWNTTGVPPGVYELPLSATTARQQTDTTLAIEIVARAAVTDYLSWSDTWPFGPGDWFDHLDPNADGIINLMAYAHGVDPVHGIGSLQPDPRMQPAVNAGTFGVTLTAPTDGRPDLLYIVERSPDLVSWTEVARKDRNGPWTGTATVTLSPLQGALSQAEITLPPEPGQTFVYVRLSVGRLAP